MRSYGCIKSKLLGNELEADRLSLRTSIPSRYELTGLPPIADQGERPTCVSQSVFDMVYWKLKGFHITPKYSRTIFYDRSSRLPEGMEPKDAFEILISDKITFGRGFTTYAKVGSIETAKRCIISHGPVLIGLPVRSFDNSFWNGSELIGGHAVTIVGYDSLGFKLRNSWGSSYGLGGYWTLPYQDFNHVFEAWTLIN